MTCYGFAPDDKEGATINIHYVNMRDAIVKQNSRGEGAREKKDLGFGAAVKTGFHFFARKNLIQCLP